MKKETSCINVISILDYFKRHNVDYSGIIGDLDPEIDRLEDPESFLRDPNNWISCTVVSKLHERATSVLHDEKAAYKMGRFVAENVSLGYAQKIVVKAFWSYKKALKHCQKINDQWNRSKKVELYELKQNEATIRLHWDPDMGTTKRICLYNQGVYTSLPSIWGGNPLILKERCCYFDGAPYCEYHLKWPFENRLHEILSRFFTSKSVLTDTIKEMEKDKKIIEEKTEKLSNMNRELQNEIAQRKNIEESLKASEEKYRTILESIEDGYFEVDIAGNLTFFNDSLCEILGYSRDELEGMNNRQYTDDEYARTVYQTFNKVYTTQKPEKGFGLTIIAKNNTIKPVEASVSLKSNAEGKPIGFRGVVRDISETQRLEAQLHQAQKMEAIGTLAGGIAHDFNNLLMAIQSRTSIILMNRDLSHPDREHLQGIAAHVESATDLTRQLLGFARGGKYEVKPTDLNELIKRESRMFGRTKKEITIRGKYKDDLWPVEVDRGQIQQVLLNLYVNAWQAMPEGGNLYLETENVTLDDNYVKPFSVEPGKYVKISISDTGIGMDKTIQEKIFDPFFTTKEPGRGTGLGLASAYGIIRNHGGVINVYSEKGEGTTFNVYLPATEKEVVKEKKSAGDTLRGIETILFVDDEEMITEVAEDLLELLGYEVLIAGSGKEAIKIYEESKERVDMVILDMIMPDMSGGEAYDRMKEINPKVKVLLSSGYSTDGRVNEILDRGCNGFIQKPFKMKELSQKLREILDEK